MMNKAVFLDRDGTINYDYSYVFDSERIKLLPKVATALALLHENNYKLFVVTNQSCIGRGMANLAQVEATNERMLELLKQENPKALIDQIYICPDHPDEPSIRRKPEGGMIKEAEEQYHLDLKQCWVIGDKISDPLSGLNAGIPKENCLIVKFNQEEHKVNSKDFRKFNDLLEAAQMITSKRL